MTIDSAVDSKI